MSRGDSYSKSSEQAKPRVTKKLEGSREDRSPQAAWPRFRLSPHLVDALARIEHELWGNPELEYSVSDHYAYVSDEVVRANLQFLYSVRRHDTRARLFEAAGLSGREGFAKDLADRCAKPLKNDEIGALAHFLDIPPDLVEPFIMRVDRKLRRAKKSTNKIGKEVA